MLNHAVIEQIQRHLTKLLTYGAYGFMKPIDSIKEGKTWHITTLGLALTRTATLLEAVQFLTVFGIEVKPTDIIDVDCCYSLIPTSMHVADGPTITDEDGEVLDFQWVISWCTLCPEGQNALASR